MRLKTNSKSFILTGYGGGNSFGGSYGGSSGGWKPASTGSYFFLVIFVMSY